MDKLFAEAGIEAFADVFPLAIRGKDGSGSEGETFLGDAKIFANPNHIANRIALPEGSWEMATLPKSPDTFEAMGISVWFMSPWCLLLPQPCRYVMHFSP